MYYKNGIIFNSQQAIRNDNKETSLPLFLSDDTIQSMGYLLISEGTKPTITSTQFITENGVTLVAGVPTKQYLVNDMFKDVLGVDGVTVVKTKLQQENEYLAQKQAEAIAIATIAWKEARQIDVDNIEVTYNTVIYQGDETSQTRMTRAIVALPDNIATINWVAKDNTVHALNKVDLQTILAQAGMAQANIWTVGRP